MPREDDLGETALVNVPVPANLSDLARSHPTRLAILALLTSHRPGARSIANLRAELPHVPAPAIVEYHLGVLRRVGLIRCHRDIEGAVYTLA